MKKTIKAGYAYPGLWKGKGTSIFPPWWDNGKHDEEKKSMNPKEIILSPNTEYTLKIDYPLNNPFVNKFKTGKKGMTRQEFVDMACEAYQYIYKIEDGDEVPGHIPGMYNRVTTDGEFGIWGHDIGDLTICTLYIDEDNLITLGVDS